MWSFLRAGTRTGPRAILRITVLGEQEFGMINWVGEGSSTRVVAMRDTFRYGVWANGGVHCLFLSFFLPFFLSIPILVSCQGWEDHYEIRLRTRFSYSPIEMHRK